MLFLNVGIVCVFITGVAESCDNATVNIKDPSRITLQIVGGSETTIDKFSYAATILLYDATYSVWSPRCGGTIITNRHVLSAAHCFVGRTNNHTNVRVGSSYSQQGGLVYNVTNIISHNKYNSTNDENDISILRITDCLTFSSTIQPAHIPLQKYKVADDTQVSIIGWGATEDNGEGSPVIREATVKIVNLSVCIERYNKLRQSLNNFYFIVDESNICTGLLDIGGVDSCQGDSGSSVLESNMIVGISAWGIGCGNGTYPSVNTRVSYYTNWIKYVVAKYQ